MATKEKIFERNPDTGVIRWRYVGESTHELLMEGFNEEATLRRIEDREND